MPNRIEGSGDETRILQILGHSALSDFRTEKLLAATQSVVPDVDNITAKYCYFVVHYSAFNYTQLEQLLQLIQGESVRECLLESSDSFLVVPRFGTSTSWSTKATDILRRSSFENILRIERGVFWTVRFTAQKSTTTQRVQVVQLLHDRMTESVIFNANEIKHLFKSKKRLPLLRVDVLNEGFDALVEANSKIGLALSESELRYLFDWYNSKGRNPTDAELMMFSQVNSEHCRHKIFNAIWSIDDQVKNQSMFSMIRKTHAHNPSGTLVAYEDNASVIQGFEGGTFFPDPHSRMYRCSSEPIHVIYKAETHNHPTAISPFPGAATGAGGEIRDEGATGRGGKPKAGVCGFSVSHLKLPGQLQPWEHEDEFPSRFATPLQLMLEGPIGSASFNNEFGRPNIGGFFRTFESGQMPLAHQYGYHKPIMFAGGIGNIRPDNVDKRNLESDNLLVVIGGPSMLIGLGGGAASSVGYGQSDEELDFASVQRSNPEMQRRCQEVINRCLERGQDNPILSIHDVGAGGLSNALPELVHASDLGAEIQLQDIPNDDSSMSPMQVWCNEAQERYVLSIDSNQLNLFERICNAERCPFAVVGIAKKIPHLAVNDVHAHDHNSAKAVDVDMKFLMGSLPKEQRVTTRKQPHITEVQNNDWALDECVERVLRLPTVGDKTFLITIGDRTVSGLIHRDQMVGPWQIPVADASVTLSGYSGYQGEAMAIGERAPIAVLNAPASARMAIGEALTNIRSISIRHLDQVKLSANWMAAASADGEGANLYDAVDSVVHDICLPLGLSIPVGKDSLSMQTVWKDSNADFRKVVAPLSLIVTAFAAVKDVRGSLTPQLVNDVEAKLLMIDLGQGKCRMGMSALHQVFECEQGEPPDFDNTVAMKNLFCAFTQMIDQELLAAYHDRSDGGLFAALCEMSFASRVGLDIEVDESTDASPIDFLFNEELGVVIQVNPGCLERVLKILDVHELNHMVHQVATVNSQDSISVKSKEKILFEQSRVQLQQIWSELSWKMQSLRDNPSCAQQEFDRIRNEGDLGLRVQLPTEPTSVPIVLTKTSPKIAILREQGVNGHVEMAAAFDHAGFSCYDVLMSEVAVGEKDLLSFDGMVLCGGFSFGDVFGAGRGWASTILCNPKLRDNFAEFFADSGKFTLGVCNGCQVLAELREIIPGASHWPELRRNKSEQFEARLIMVRIPQSKSIFFSNMLEAELPIAVAHGEGRAKFKDSTDYASMETAQEICMQYIDNQGQLTDVYPYNPNGSDFAVAGITNCDGRVTAIMPHPERVFRNIQFSWTPESKSGDSPWMKMFRNARIWLN